MRRRQVNKEPRNPGISVRNGCRDRESSGEAGAGTWNAEKPARSLSFPRLSGLALFPPPALIAVVALAGRVTADEPFSELPRNAWVKLSPVEGSPPSPRLGYEGACVWDSARGLLIRYGGHNQGGGGEQNAEVWTFDPRAARWELHEPNTSPPGVCCAQQNVFDPARARYVRFPAFSASHGWQWRREVWLNDSTVWTYDPGTETWRNLRPLPAPRVRPLRCASRDARHEVVVVFGGEGSREGTLVYDPYTNRWTRMRPATEPAFRSAGNMAYDAARDVHVLFGAQFTDDPHTWTYDLRKNEWRDMEPESMPPTNRNDAVLAYDAVSRKVIAIVKVTRGEGEDATHRLETWTYDAGANRWEKVEPSGEPDPSGNRARCLVSAPELGGVLLENCTHPPHAAREQQVWFYRLGDPSAAETREGGVKGGDDAPLRPPPDLRVTTEPDAALLEWTPSPSPDVARYVVLRAEGELPWKVELRPVAELDAGSRTYRDEEVERGTVLHYAVRVEDAARRKSPPSPRARAQPPVVEDAVVSVLSADEVEISWTPPPESDIAGYHVERAAVEVWSEDELRPLESRTPPLDPPAAGAIRRIGNPLRLTSSPIRETTYRDTSVDLGEPRRVEEATLYERSFPDERLDAGGKAYPFGVYAYRIVSVNALGVESGPSPAFFTIPSAPRSVFSKEEGTTCRLRWRENPEKSLRGYRVYRMNGRYDSAKIARLAETPVSEPRFADPDAGERTRRYYVVAVDALGQEGFPSAPVWFEREWKRFYEPFTGEWHQ